MELGHEVETRAGRLKLICPECILWPGLRVAPKTLTGIRQHDCQQSLGGEDSEAQGWPVTCPWPRCGTQTESTRRNGPRLPVGWRRTHTHSSCVGGEVADVRRVCIFRVTYLFNWKDQNTACSNPFRAVSLSFLFLLPEIKPGAPPADSRPQASPSAS